MLIFTDVSFEQYDEELCFSPGFPVSNCSVSITCSAGYSDGSMQKRPNDVRAREGELLQGNSILQNNKTDAQMNSKTATASTRPTQVQTR